MLRKRYLLNLRLFDGAAAAGGAAPTGDISTSDAGKSKGEKVVYGVQAEIEQTTQPEQTQDASEKPSTVTTSDTLEAKKAEYAKFKQEYKDFFTEDTQNIIDKRFKETKILEKQLNDIKPLIELLGPKYNVTDGDPAKLAKAIQEDTSLWEDEAAEKGLTVEQLKYMKQLERENETFRKAQQEAEARRGAQETFNRWVQQAEQMKTVYPNFDLDAEIRNPKTGEMFMRQLKAGVDVKTAYQAIHFDEILPTAMQTTAQKVQEATVKNIQSRNSRPLENGVNSSTGVIVKNDVSKLTAADRAEIRRRVLAGEKISF